MHTKYFVKLLYIIKEFTPLWVSSLANIGRATDKVHMSDSLLMLDLVRVVYWFDEQLQQALAERGWGSLNRSQSLVLANVANGETRSARIAEKLGVSRQALSQLTAELITRDILELAPDPQDKRARILQFTPRSHGIRDDAQAILRNLEDQIAASTSTEALNTVKATMRGFLASDTIR